MELTQGTISKLEVSAGDSVVIQYPLHLSIEQREYLYSYARASLPEGVRVLVLDSGAAVSVVSAESGPEHG